MKRIINTVLISVASVLLFSCNLQEEIDIPMNETIVLDLSSGVTRADIMDDNPTESFVNHIDVIIFDDNAGSPDVMRSYGRYTVNNASRLTLSDRRSSFEAAAPYHVYLIANSNLSEADFASVEYYTDFVGMKQTDRNLHLTGLTGVAAAPKYFLMDAKAGNGTVVLNNGNIADNTELTANLRRAAAKVVVKITAGPDVKFADFDETENGELISDGGLYYIRNLPYQAFLLAEARADDTIDANVVEVRNTDPGYDGHFIWNPENDNQNASLVTYVYPNSWSTDIINNETCAVVNLPLIYTPDGGEPVEHHNSWYKIHLTGEKVFRRNNYYEVNVEINRPGAISETVPVDLEDLRFEVEKWGEQEIKVGGDDKPKYLMVNREQMEMHNIAVDSKTLEFASSSPVVITVENVYYYNKFGQKTSVSPRITGTTDGGIAGNITVNSPVPTNNAIRYFTLVVRNQDGLTERVEVTQYPLEYITNTQGYYSYRSDFYNHDSTPSAPTRYDFRGDSYVSASWNTDRNSWSYSSSNGSNSGYFFRSKVAVLSTNNLYAGKSNLYYYSWAAAYNSASFATMNTLYKSASDDEDPGNARMYHVQITSTSNEYTLGIPKRDSVTDYTLSDQENSRLVSPSFMIASQLGATSSTSYTTSTYISRAKSHCSQYVETYFDDKNENGKWDNGETIHHLDDWRLPTEAEIAIIVKFQTSSEVMDVVLAGANYFCASPRGYVATGVDSGSSIYTRCIRDVY